MGVGIPRRRLDYQQIRLLEHFGDGAQQGRDNPPIIESNDTQEGNRISGLAKILKNDHGASSLGLVHHSGTRGDTKPLPAGR
jgi:hypothetical protein